MIRRCGVIAPIFFALALALSSTAQDNKEAGRAPDRSIAFYRLDLSVREMDGTKVVNNRNYTLNAKGDDYGRFRVGSRVPIATAGDAFQYIDVGLNADCHVIELDPGPTLVWTIELSSVAPEVGVKGQPVIRNVRSQGQTLLTLNKPIVLSNTDDLSSTHKFVFEVTATKIK